MGDGEEGGLEPDVSVGYHREEPEQKALQQKRAAGNARTTAHTNKDTRKENYSAQNQVSQPASRIFTLRSNPKSSNEHLLRKDMGVVS